MKKMIVIRKVLVEIVPAFDHTEKDLSWYRNDEWGIEDAIEYAKEVSSNGWNTVNLYYEYYTENGDIIATELVKTIA